MRLIRGQFKAWKWFLALGFIVSLIGLVQPSGQAILVKEVPNPQTISGTWITDMAELISPDSEIKLNQMITDLETANGAEIAIVTVYNTQPSPTPKAFATELFNTWGIGKQGENNGVLFLVSKDERRTEIETGSGLDKRLPITTVKKILQRQITPQFKVANFDAGIVNGTRTLIATIEAKPWSIQDLPGRRTAISLLFVSIALCAQRVVEHKTAAGLQLSPRQEHSLPAINRWQRWIFLGIRWLAGNQIFAEQLPTLQKLEESYTNGPTSKNWLQTHRYPKMFPEVFDKNTPTPQELERAHIKRLASISWLQVHHYPRQLTNHGLKLMLVGISLGIGIISMLPRNSFTLFLMMPVYPLVWLGCEMWACTRWAKRLFSESDAEQAKQEILGKIGCVCFAVTAVFMLVGLFTPKIAVGVVSGIIFTCAGLVRYIRLNPLNSQPVVCNDCASTMEKLSPTQLECHLTKPQTIEMGLKSVVYEGWHCPNHGTKKREHSLDCHLISYLVTDNAIGHCTTCKALTVDVTTIVKKPATSALPGCKVVTQKCHCCDLTTQTEELIPKRPVSRRQSNSSYTNSYNHTNSSYHSSDSGSSADNTSDGGFGGGSSDGGGAGDSW
ncbi:MAG: TPM domain-containing protein [Leptolyngbyaceae cyanobacterium]